MRHPRWNTQRRGIVERHLPGLQLISCDCTMPELQGRTAELRGAGITRARLMFPGMPQPSHACRRFEQLEKMMFSPLDTLELPLVRSVEFARIFTMWFYSKPQAGLSFLPFLLNLWRWRWWELSPLLLRLMFGSELEQSLQSTDWIGLCVKPTW